MSGKNITVTPALHDYILSVTLREPPVLAKLRAETARHPRHNMQIAPEQGQFMAMLMKLIGARRTIEVGVFTGYSSLAVALALPPGGHIVACDVSDEYTRIARKYWEEAGVADRITLKLAPALETLDALLADGGAGTFDFAFIDADKANYPGYFERCLKLLRTNGLLAFDNTLWSGSVANPPQPTDDADTLALRRLNEALHRDERIDLSLIPMADGITLCRKR
jgi:predicted O-methyltransferase YrrM